MAGQRKPLRHQATKVEADDQVGVAGVASGTIGIDVLYDEWNFRSGCTATN
jgi:hypothetical protein